MREYARLQTAMLLRRLAYQVTHAGKSGDPDAIHDLRVAVRRFSACLRAFAPFYPPHAARRVRRRLSGLMEVAGLVRDLDVTLDLLRQSGTPTGAPLAAALRSRRAKAEARLEREIHQWTSRGFSRKWRSRLNL